MLRFLGDTHRMRLPSKALVILLLSLHRHPYFPHHLSAEQEKHNPGTLRRSIASHDASSIPLSYKSSAMD